MSLADRIETGLPTPSGTVYAALPKLTDAEWRQIVAALRLAGAYREHVDELMKGVAGNESRAWAVLETEYSFYRAAVSP